jgi:hypothetical protein
LVKITCSLAQAGPAAAVASAAPTSQHTLLRFTVPRIFIVS